MINGFMHIIYGCNSWSRWLSTYCVVYRRGLFVFKHKINFYFSHIIINCWHFYKSIFNSKTKTFYGLCINEHHYYHKIWRFRTQNHLNSQYFSRLIFLWYQMHVNYDSYSFFVYLFGKVNTGRESLLGTMDFNSFFIIVDFYIIAV